MPYLCFEFETSTLCAVNVLFIFAGGGKHLNAPHPCLSLSAVHAKGVSWHLIYHVRLSASYVLTGFVVFTAVVWYIYYCEGCFFFFKSMTYLEKDLF